MFAPPDDDTLPTSDAPANSSAPAPMFKWPFLAVMIVAAVGLFALAAFLPSRSTKSQLIEPPVEKQALTNQLPLKVHIIGEVNSPGLYVCRSNERIQDAIMRAGGATPNADMNAINLSAFLEDGQQIRVPALVVSTPNPTIAPAEVATPAVAQPVAGTPLNLNTATQEQLEALPTIGPATASHILAMRQVKGQFKSVEELDEIPGIGIKTMQTLRPLVTVN
jgi:competence protein ComEA